MYNLRFRQMLISLKFTYPRTFCELWAKFWHKLGKLKPPRKFLALFKQFHFGTEQPLAHFVQIIEEKSPGSLLREISLIAQEDCE